MPLYRNRFQGHCAAGDIFVFTWWITTGPSDLPAAHGAAQTWLNTIWNAYAPLTTPDVGVDNVSTSEVDPQTGRQSVQAESAVTLAGSSTSSAMPADVAIVVSERSATANRSGRGRFYLPQPSVDVVSSTGLLSSSTMTTIADAAGTAYSDALTAGFQPVIYSPTYKMSRPIISIDVGNHADTQRRRENAVPVSRERRQL